MAVIAPINATVTAAAVSSVLVTSVFCVIIGENVDVCDKMVREMEFELL